MRRIWLVYASRCPVRKGDLEHGEHGPAGCSADPVPAPRETAVPEPSQPLIQKSRRFYT